MTWVEEFLFVLIYSTRTQVAILFGIAFFFGTLFLGYHLASNIIFQGVLAPLADAIRPIIEHRYEKVAWGSLLSFLLLSFQCYRKDRKRLFNGL
jgi:hypothetical protein